MRTWFYKIIPVFCIITVGISWAKDTATLPEITVEQFVNLYVQLSITAETFLDDSLKLAQNQDSIFEANAITRTQFDSFRKKMDLEPDKWGNVWEQIVKKLEELDKNTQWQNKGQQAIQPDSTHEKSK